MARAAFPARRRTLPDNSAFKWQNARVIWLPL